MARITLASRRRKGLAMRLYTDSPSRRRQEWIASTRVCGCQLKILKVTGMYSIYIFTVCTACMYSMYENVICSQKEEELWYFYSGFKKQICVA